MKWEYRTVKLRVVEFKGGQLNEIELENQINEMGLKGWELATSFYTYDAGMQARELVLLFKRSY
ncbi:MAG: DUF4177 domain-containing protein [Kiritimatiellae bacterium]|nr:DUF4177 domain-containing protein [Kiritimatiellia bacterium]